MKKFALLTTLLCSLTLSATTYFASPAGKGDGSSITSPTTFKAGVSALKNGGDTLYLLEGTYTFTDKFSINKKGSSSQYIVIAGYPGDNVLLDFHQVPYGTRGITIHADALFVHLKDFAIAWSGKNNLYCEGSYCLFENLDIYGSADTGCQMKKGGNNIILNVDSHDNFDYQTMSGTTANFGGNADGFADKQFSGSGNHYIGCRAWNNSDDGWDFFQRVSSSQTIIENCVCYRNGAPYYDMTHHPRVQTDQAWFNSMLGTQMKDRYGNTITITLDKYPNQGNGNGFKLGGGGTNHKVLLHHSLSVANYSRGFDQNNNDGEMVLVNNTAHANSTNYGFTTKYGSLAISNCITFQSQNTDSYKAKSMADSGHNSWENGLKAEKSDFRSLDTTQILAKRTAEGALPDGSCLRLVTGSKLIDAGINVGLAYNGEAPDLGCYETDGEHHDPDPESEEEKPQPEGVYSVAYVTIFDSDEDQTILAHLFQNDSLYVTQTNAQVPDIDYSTYDLILISSKPNSGAAGLAALKGYNKPMVVLKPFLFKPNVWNWGTAVNTSELNINVTKPEHPLFHGLTITDGQLNVFSECNTNAVTGISEWVNTEGFDVLGTSAEGLTSIAEFAAGTDCNGTILPQPLIMIGVSEYSTVHLTQDGLQLIENAILYLLGINMPDGIENHPSSIINHKYIHEGQLFIQAGDAVYDVTGRRVMH